jgi:hypothetical protein
MVDSFATSMPFRLGATTRRVSVRMASFGLAARRIPRRDMTDRLLLPYPFDDEHPRLSGSVLAHERKAFHDAFNASAGCLHAGGRFLPLPVCQRCGASRASDIPSPRARRALSRWTCSLVARGLDDCHSRSVKNQSFHRPRCLPSKGIESLSPTWFPTKEDRFDALPISRLRRRDRALDALSRRCLLLPSAASTPC